MYTNVSLLPYKPGLAAAAGAAADLVTKLRRHLTLLHLTLLLVGFRRSFVTTGAFTGLARQGMISSSGSSIIVPFRKIWYL